MTENKQTLDERFVEDLRERISNLEQEIEWARPMCRKGNTILGPRYEERAVYKRVLDHYLRLIDEYKEVKH